MNQDSQNGSSAQPEICKNCGACPYCGRGGYKFGPVYPYQPTWPPYYPYIGDAPYWNSLTTITIASTAGSWCNQ